MYMHHFGGVYADLDLVPLRAFPADLPILNVSHQNQTSYLGHMGGVFHEHSIPNAFMASTAPNHPFWLRPLQFVRENMKYDSDPEHLTGPVALQTCFFQWSKERKSRIQSTGVPADVIVLPSETVCPSPVPLVSLFDLTNATHAWIRYIPSAGLTRRWFITFVPPHNVGFDALWPAYLFYICVCVCV